MSIGTTTCTIKKLIGTATDSEHVIRVNQPKIVISPILFARQLLLDVDQP
jgi:hypothetical protein